MPIGVKVVNVFDGNLALDLPNHLAMIMLFDQDTGATCCVMDGTYITGIRTAASAVLSARMLGRADARVATVIGAGVQGREHLRLLPLIRDFERINVCSLYADEAERLAARNPLAQATQDVEAAVRESDIVCLASHSATPVIRAEWLKPGAHVSSVGYHPPAGELPTALAREHRLFVETLDALEPPGRLRRARGHRPRPRHDARGRRARACTGTAERQRNHRLQGNGDRDGGSGCRKPGLPARKARAGWRRDGLVTGNAPYILRVNFIVRRLEESPVHTGAVPQL